MRGYRKKNLFVQGYNHTYLEVHAVIKYVQKHRVGTALLIISHVQTRVLGDVISRNRNKKG